MRQYLTRSNCLFWGGIKPKISSMGFFPLRNLGSRAQPWLLRVFSFTEVAELPPACRCSKGDVFSHLPALGERFCSSAFSLSQVWEKEAASSSWLCARDGASLAVLSISCSVQVQTCWKKKFQQLRLLLALVLTMEFCQSHPCLLARLLWRKLSL